LTSYIVCHSSGSADAIGSMPRAPPASLTSSAQRGAAAANAATESADVTSSVIASPSISAASWSSRGRRRAAQITR